MRVLALTCAFLFLGGTAAAAAEEPSRFVFDAEVNAFPITATNCPCRTSRLISRSASTTCLRDRKVWDTPTMGAVTIRSHPSGVVAESYRTGEIRVVLP